MFNTGKGIAVKTASGGIRRLISYFTIHVAQYFGSRRNITLLWLHTWLSSKLSAVIICGV
jgi:hypothetical protein